MVLVQSLVKCENIKFIPEIVPHQVTFSEPSIFSSASEFQSEPVEGRKVSKVVKTTVVHGERMEKQHGDSSLATDLPSAKEDFEEVELMCFFHRIITLLPGCVYQDPHQKYV